MWAARLDLALHTPHGVAFCKSFWAHRNPAGKPTPPQKCSFFMKRGVFLPMFSTTFLNNQSFSTIATYAVM